MSCAVQPSVSQGLAIPSTHSIDSDRENLCTPTTVPPYAGGERRQRRRNTFGINSPPVGWTGGLYDGLCGGLCGGW